MAERDLQKEFDALKRDLNRVQTDLKKLTETGGEMASEALQSARAKLEEETQRLIERLQITATEAKVKGQQALHEVEHQVEEHPMASLLTSFGVGFLVGWLISRK